MRDRILVVAGARALDVSPAARLWAMRELAARVLSGRYTTVVQGRCAKSPDEWADELAKLGRLVRIAWPIDGGPQVLIPVRPFGWHVRDLRDAARYPYRDPAPAPRWRLTPYRALVILAGLVFFVALVQLVRVLGQAWQAG